MVRSWSCGGGGGGVGMSKGSAAAIHESISFLLESQMSDSRRLQISSRTGTGTCL